MLCGRRTLATGWVPSVTATIRSEQRRKDEGWRHGRVGKASLWGFRQ